MIKRGYNPDFFSKEIDRARRVPREDTLRDKQSVTNQRIPFVATFHPALPNIAKILHSLLSVLQSSRRCQGALGQVPTVAFRRPKSLKDILVVVRSFFASFWTTTSSRSINTRKRTWPISSHLDLTLGQ